MDLTKDSEDYSTFASVVNNNCNDVKLSELRTNNFKCLIFVQGLVSVKDAEIRRRVLNKFGKQAKPYSSTNSGRLLKVRRLRQDSRNIEESGMTHVKKRYAKRKI